MSLIPNRKVGHVVPFEGMGNNLGGASEPLEYKPRNMNAQPIDNRKAIVQLVPGNTGALNDVRTSNTRRTAVAHLKFKSFPGMGQGPPVAQHSEPTLLDREGGGHRVYGRVPFRGENHGSTHRKTHKKHKKKSGKKRHSKEVSYKVHGSRL
jgi:hypothetical protein